MLLILTYTGHGISRVEGIILLVIMVIYITILIKNAIKNKIEEEETKAMSVLKSIIFIILGLVAIVFGGDFVVDAASGVAKQIGVSDLLIGLTIVAIGTSLPELVTSVVAAKKGESGLALGNAVGSCIFNIIFILGLSGTVSPIGVAKADFTFVLIDIFVLIVVGMIIQVFCITREKVSRFEGGICVALYVAYTAYIIMRTIM